MKTITYLITFLAITIGSSQDLLLDGNFENTDPMSGGQGTGVLPNSGAIWTTSQSSSQPSINNNNAVAHTGDLFMNLGNDFKTFRQTITASMGVEYTVTFWNQYIGNQGLPYATDGTYIQIRSDDGSNNGNGSPFDPAISLYIDPQTGDLNWTEFSFNFTAPQTNLILYVFKQARAVGGASPPGNPNNASRMDDFSITPALSVNDLLKFNFSATPNPTKDYINLSASITIEKVEVYNLLGQQVKSVGINSNETRMDVSSLSKGIYILKAYIEDASGSYKFIKE